MSVLTSESRLQHLRVVVHVVLCVLAFSIPVVGPAFPGPPFSPSDFTLNLVLHFLVLHFPPSDLPIIVVLHFPVITFTLIVVHCLPFSGPPFSVNPISCEVEDLTNHDADRSVDVIRSANCPRCHLSLTRHVIDSNR